VFYFADVSVTIELDSPLGEEDFLLGNVDNVGWYRVNYDLEGWERIIHTLNTNFQVQ